MTLRHIRAQLTSRDTRMQGLMPPASVGRRPNGGQKSRINPIFARKEQVFAHRDRPTATAERTNTDVINTFKSLAVTQTSTPSPDLKDRVILGTVPAPPTVQVMTPVRHGLFPSRDGVKRPCPSRCD